MTIRLRNSSLLVKKKNTRNDNSSHIAKLNHNTCLLFEKPQLLHILFKCVESISKYLWVFSVWSYMN